MVKDPEYSEKCCVAACVAVVVLLVAFVAVNQPTAFYAAAFVTLTSSRHSTQTMILVQSPSKDWQRNTTFLDNICDTAKTVKVAGHEFPIEWATCEIACVFEAGVVDPAAVTWAKECEFDVRYTYFDHGHNLRNAVARVKADHPSAPATSRFYETFRASVHGVNWKHLPPPYIHSITAVT